MFGSAVTKMHPFIPVAVSLLCLNLGSGDKLAAASDANKFYKEEEQISSLFQSIDTVYKLLNSSTKELNGGSSEDVGSFAYTYEPLSRSRLDIRKSKHQHYIVHGWKGNMFEKWINDTAKAILKSSDKRVIRFGYSKPAALDYFLAAGAVQKKIGKELAQHIIEEYENDRVSLDKLTLIGHGLGAHVVGIAGKRIYKKLGKRVKQIIGLSPAGPIFHFASDNRKLHKDDAECVVALHTDQKLFGYNFAIGGLDFYANGGTRQPGCDNLLSPCSHMRARSYLMEAFGETICEEEEEEEEWLPKPFASNSDQEKFISVVRGDCSIGNGKYYFDTDSDPPYLSDN